MANALFSRAAHSGCAAGTRLPRFQGPEVGQYRSQPGQCRHWSFVLRTRRVPCQTVVRSSWDEAFNNLLKSSVFESEHVKKEHATLIKEHSELLLLESKFPDFDLAGKRMFVDKMADISERHKVFLKRLELSQDPAAREYLRATNADMQEHGYTLNKICKWLDKEVAKYRTWVEQEERFSNDPQTHQEFLRQIRDVWASGPLVRANLSDILRTIDPEVFKRAYGDPKFWAAMKEVTTRPTPEVMGRWLDDPNIGPLVAEMWKIKQQGRLQTEMWKSMQGGQ